MLKKVLIIVGAVVLLVGACVATWAITNARAQEIIDGLAADYATLEAKQDSWGDPVTRYTVRTQVSPGTQLTEDMLVEMSIPGNWVTDDYCVLSEIITPVVTEKDGEETVTYIGQFAKTYINPGTPVTKSLLMNEKIENTLREIDVVANRWPIGLKVGDYVDIRITYPYGEDFIVLSHKRVYEVNEQTLKLHMTEEEQHLYQAALVDYYLHLQDGMDIYFTKYIEPGVQKEATAYYSVPHNIATVCLSDPNIIDHAMVSVKDNLLEIQQGSNTTDDPTHSGFIRSGRDRLNSAVNSDYNAWRNDYQQEQEQAAKESNGSLIDGGVD